MLFWIIIKVSLKSLWGAKLRSFLAILGIIMGVGAVISMLSIIEGARREMSSMIGGLGTDVLFIWPQYRSAQGKGSAPELKLEDAQAILQDAPAVISISPELQTSVSIKHTNQSNRASVEGVAPTYFLIRNIVVEKGRPFTDNETDHGSRVVVLGSKTAEKVFGTKDPIGEHIKMNRLVYRVIGVLKSTGARGFNNEDDRILAPYTAVTHLVLGRHANLGSIVVQAVSTERLREAEEQIRAILRKRHRIKPDDKDDFGIFNQAQIIEMQQKALGIFTIVLGGVGGICLLTGGIGIMNIMLVTVTERTREIGVRKAIGAKNRDILLQFLLEAVIMSGIGGIIGIACGSGLALLLSSVTPLKTAVSAGSVVLALSFAAGVGIFFGYYPAVRAARLDPIEALRCE